MLQELSQEQFAMAVADFTYFTNTVFASSWPEYEPFLRGDHFLEWCDMFKVKNTCIISGRKHGKSTIAYAWVMWKLLRSSRRDYELQYFSFKKELARWHVTQLKRLIRNNPFFVGIRDLDATAEGIGKYSWDGTHRLQITPKGILGMERGPHPDDVICDDIFQDPANTLQLDVIEKVNRLVKEEIFSLPKEGGGIKIVGTAQTPSDILWELKKLPGWAWGEYRAIANEKLKLPLWPQKFSWERLMEIRKELGEKGFDKEFLCKPVWSADSYFRQEQIMACVNPRLQNEHELHTKNDVGIGWDIGKHSHPAFVAVFEFVPLASEAGAPDLAVQRFFRWMDGWEYKRQLDFVKTLVENLRADYVNFDNTRGELEGFYEKGLMDRTVFFPFTFSVKTKNGLASEFEKRVTHIDRNGDLSPTIQLINDERSIRQILAVNNDLDAPVSHDGHGDSFFGIALALHRRRLGEFIFLKDPDNLTGLM